MRTYKARICERDFRICMKKRKQERHGMTNTRFYRIWYLMKARHKIKGLEHATCCERWQWFTNFRDDMLESYEKHHAIHGDKDTSIDRIDNMGTYHPDNCRWATVKMQNNNRRNHNNYNAKKTHCLNGHPYDEKNTYVHKDKKTNKTGRHCRKCSRHREREKYGYKKRGSVIMVIEDEFTCSSCKKVKPKTSFHKNKQNRRGHSYKCKECESIRGAKKYLKYRERRLLRDKERNAGRGRKYGKPDPWKAKARNALNYAIKKGRIKKQPCVQCGEEKVHGHHEDYSKPLDVIWLCIKHHYERHRKYTEAELKEK